MALATGMLARVIDPDSAVPPYEQVAKMLRDEIAQGTMTGRIPSVHAIAEHQWRTPACPAATAGNSPSKWSMVLKMQLTIASASSELRSINVRINSSVAS